MKTYLGTYLRGTSSQPQPRMVVDDKGHVVTMEPRVGQVLSLPDEDLATLTFDEATALTPYFEWTLEPSNA